MTAQAAIAPNAFAAIFEQQQQHAPQVALTTAKERIQKINAIKDWVNANEARIQTALYDDLRKSEMETKISEMLPVLTEARHIVKNLRRWMRPEPIPIPLRLFGTTGDVYHEPKGNCLIISPWNYPFNLTVKPLLQAIAAGNVIIIKPSELTPGSSALLREMANELFTANEVTVIEGDATTAIELQKLPFNHIFFTGSPAVGKLVMAAAATHLASVTLELGGKSPVIIDETARIHDAAKKMAFGKFINNGQTCIAPDYGLVHQTVFTNFLAELKNQINTLYGSHIQSNPDYCRIINKRHLERLIFWLEDAKAKGATVAFGGEYDLDDLYFSPTILTNVTDDMIIMQEEIFGPILPLLSFNVLDEIMHYINARPKPLALYLFSKSDMTKNYINHRTSAGAMVINDIAIHYFVDESPFGGVNNSGIGKSFGHYGFVEFSNIKPVIENKFSQTSLFHPPYSEFRKRLIDFIGKYL